MPPQPADDRFTWPSSAGWPGRTAIPATATAPTWARTAPVLSSRPRLDPAMTSTRSAPRAARLISAARASGSSDCTSLTTAAAPSSRHRAASISELVSMMSPRRSAAPTVRISSPVGMIATTGRLYTATDAWPPAAAAARSPGRSRRPARTSTSPAPKSSPARRTCLPRTTPVLPVMMTLPSACGSSHSRSTTVSAPSGMGSPVSIHSNAPGGSRTGSPARAPAPSASPPAVPAPTAAARVAMPSIAEQSDRGDGHRARTGEAVTRPNASATGT